MFAPKGLGRRWALLIGGDVAISTWAAYYAFGENGQIGLSFPSPEHYHLAALTLTTMYLGLFYFQDLYEITRRRTRAWVATSVLTASAKATVLVAIVAFAIPAFDYGRRFYLVYMLSSSTVLLLWRVAVNRLIFDRLSIGVMAFGFAEYAPLLAEEAERLGQLGWRFLGFASYADGASRSLIAGAQPHTIHQVSSIDDLTRRFNPNILVLLGDGDHAPSVRELVKCRSRGIQVFDFETFYELTTGKLPLPFVRESWLLYAPGFAGSHWQRLIERGLDIVAALALALATLPLSLATAIAIKLDSEGPVFYSQDRVGLDGAVFRVRKFRSMRQDAERTSGAVWASAEDPRITRVGRVIRKLRIDELPQLLNVLRGDMSLVGPRPERPEIVARLSEEIAYYDYRHFVRPGITGWAQVCYPYGASVGDAREKLCYDLYYIKNWSLFFDLQIILQTVKVVIFGRGAR